MILLKLSKIRPHLCKSQCPFLWSTDLNDLQQLLPPVLYSVIYLLPLPILPPVPHSHWPPWTQRVHFLPTFNTSGTLFPQGFPTWFSSSPWGLVPHLLGLECPVLCESFPHHYPIEYCIILSQSPSLLYFSL